MALPHWEWLRSRLETTHHVSGGYETRFYNHPMTAGAGLVMSLFWIVIWLVALVPSLLWVGARRLTGG